MELTVTMSTSRGAVAAECLVAGGSGETGKRGIGHKVDDNFYEFSIKRNREMRQWPQGETGVKRI